MIESLSLSQLIKIEIYLLFTQLHMDITTTIWIKFSIISYTDIHSNEELKYLILNKLILDININFSSSPFRGLEYVIVI